MASLPSTTPSLPLPLPKGTIKAVLFDLDGTLLDTEALSDKANLKNFNGMLPPHVQDEIDKIDGRLPWEAKKQILGLRASSWVPILISYAQEKWGVTTPLSIEEFAKGWEDNLNSFCEEIRACPGATQVVSQFVEAGLPMAIATSSRQAAVAKKRKRYDCNTLFFFALALLVSLISCFLSNRQIGLLIFWHLSCCAIRHESIFQHISSVTCGDDPELKHDKPAPDIYLLAAKRMGVNPAECLVFEDAMVSLREAYNLLSFSRDINMLFTTHKSYIFKMAEWGYIRKGRRLLCGRRP